MYHLKLLTRFGFIVEIEYTADKYMVNADKFDVHLHGEHLGSVTEAVNDLFMKMPLGLFFEITGNHWDIEEKAV